MNHPVWKVGDLVRFNHQASEGPTRRVEAVIFKPGEPSMVEIEGMSGQFAMHLFVAAPTNAGDVQDAAAGER